MTFEDEIEILSSKAFKTTILKVKIEHLVPVMPFIEHLPYLLKQEERLARASYPHKHLQRETVEVVIARKDIIFLYIFLIIEKHLL